MTHWKCRFFGHDWINKPYAGYRRCYRCDEREDVDIEEIHHDENASYGDVHFRVDDGKFCVEQYQITGRDWNTAEFRWAPVFNTSVDDDDLRALRDEIDEALGTNESEQCMYDGGGCTADAEFEYDGTSVCEFHHGLMKQGIYR